MVSADNVNQDVLGLIFDHLPGADLVAAASVSHSFHDAAIPRLYASLHYRLKQAKRVPPTRSPFAVVLTHPEYASHVREIEIRRFPTISDKPRPDFLRDSVEVLKVAAGLVRFAYVSQMDVLPSYLPVLQDREELQDLRLYAKLNSREHAELLLPIRGRLSHLHLDNATPHVLDILPRWAESIAPHLTTLTLWMASELNEDVLSSALAHLPHLRGLHVTHCPKIDHVSVLTLVAARCPNLESLAFTTWEHSRALPPDLAPLPHVRHLAVDSHCHTATPTILLWRALLNLAPARTLTSATLRMSHRVVSIDEHFMRDALGPHAATLRSVAFLNCTLNVLAIMELATMCKELRKLAVAVPLQFISTVSRALSLAPRLVVFTDVGEDNSNHATVSNITREQVRTLMSTSPKMRTLLTPQRRWKGTETRHGLVVEPEPRQPDANRPWYLPDGDY